MIIFYRLTDDLCNSIHLLERIKFIDPFGLMVLHFRGLLSCPQSSLRASNLKIDWHELKEE
jgi:hypothetical protein